MKSTVYWLLLLCVLPYSILLDCTQTFEKIPCWQTYKCKKLVNFGLLKPWPDLWSPNFKYSHYNGCMLCNKVVNHVEFKLTHFIISQFNVNKDSNQVYIYFIFTFILNSWNQSYQIVHNYKQNIAVITHDCIKLECALSNLFLLSSNNCICEQLLIGFNQIQHFAMKVLDRQN